MNSNSWQSIFDKYHIDKHNFNKEPFYINDKRSY